MEEAARIGQEYESNVSVQQVLETISDTILQIVLFQVEAKENESELVNLNVKPLLGAMNYLIDLARRKAEKWVGIAEEKNQKNMLRTCATMSNATETIDKSLDALKQDAYNDKAKDELLWAARTVVQCTVTLLQLADNYDIRKIIQCCKDAEAEQNKLTSLKPEDMGQLPDIIRAYIFHVVSLAKIVEARANYVPDPALARKFREANESVSSLPEPLIQLQVNGVSNKDERSIAQAREHDKKLKEAYKNITKYAKLSSQEMFAGIDLDLNPLDNDDPNAMKVPGSGQNFPELLKKLQTAVESNQPTKALQIAQLMQDPGAEQVNIGKNAAANEADPNKRKLIEQAAANLANDLKNMLNNAKAYATNAANRGKMLEAINAVVDSSDAMRQAMDMPDDFDKAAEGVALSLAGLHSAVHSLDEPSINSALKQAVAAIQDQVREAEAEKLKNPAKKKAIEEAIKNMPEVLRALLGGTKAVLASKDGPDSLKAKQAMQAFDAALENAESFSRRIEDVMNPERVANMANATPEEKLKALTDRVKRGVADLQMVDSPQRFVHDMKEVGKMVGDVILHAKKIGLADAAAELQKALKEIVAQARPYAMGMNNAQSKKAFDVALTNLLNKQQQAIDAILTPEQLAMYATPGLEADSAALLEAINKGNQRGVDTAVENIKRNLHTLAHAARTAPVSGDEAERLRKLALDEEAIAEQLPLAVSKAMTSKDFKPLQILLDNAKAKAHEITAVTNPDLEGSVIANSAKLAKLGQMLEAGLESGNEEAVREALEEIMSKLHDDDVFCQLLASKTTNKKLKQTLLDCGQDIADLLAKLAEASGEGLNFNMNELQELLQKIKKVNDVMVNASGDPVEKMAEIGAHINNLIDSIEFPVVPLTETAIRAVVDGMEQQILLAEMVGNAHPERKEELERAAERTRKHLERLNPTINELFTDIDNNTLQRRMQALLEDTKELNNDLIEGSQPPLWERLIANCNALSRDLTALAEHLKSGNKPSAQSVMESATNKMLVNASLVLSGAKKVSNDKLTQDLQEAGAEQQVVGEIYREIGPARVEGGGDWSVTAKYNSASNRAKKVNDAILSLAKKALAGGVETELEELEEIPSDNTASQLGVISLKVKKVSNKTVKFTF